MKRLRRVVTGLDAEGRSCVLIDAPVPETGRISSVIWRSDAIPADNSGTADAAASYDPSRSSDGGSNFTLIEFPPGTRLPMHATNTLDYMVVLHGQIVLELETGEVTLGPGDALVDRGVLHGWRNDGTEMAVSALIDIPSHPLSAEGAI